MISYMDVVYGMNVSADGYVEDASGGLEWSVPNEDLHRYANELMRTAEAVLWGRRLFELMEDHWPAAAERDDLPEVEAEFARAYVDTPKVVFSDTLEEAPAGARLVRSDEAVAEVARLKAQPGEGHLDLGGPTLAASLVDLIDEFQTWTHPVVIGSGKRYWPRVEVPLRLVETRELSGGVVVARYRRA